MDQKERALEKKQHNDIILGDSRARGCAGEVSHLLNNDFEVLEFVNLGLGMDKHCGPTPQVYKKNAPFQGLTQHPHAPAKRSFSGPHSAPTQANKTALFSTESCTIHRAAVPTRLQLCGILSAELRITHCTIGHNKILISWRAVVVPDSQHYGIPHW
jgi:hypothetical protein